MAVFRVERNKGYTVMSNHHLRNKEISLKAKGLLSQMLSLPEDWDYTLKGLSLINREKIDAIREAIRELERAGYIVRSRERDEKGRLRGADYVIFEQPQPPTPDLPTLENPTLDNPTQEKPTLEKPTLENPTQLNKDIQRTDLPKKEKIITDEQSTHSIPILSPNPSPCREAATPPERKGTEATAQSAVEIYREIIKDNIDYHILKQDMKFDSDRLDEIVDLMLETVCTARKRVRIAGDDYPAELTLRRLDTVLNVDKQRHAALLSGGFRRLCPSARYPFPSHSWERGRLWRIYPPPRREGWHSRGGPSRASRRKRRAFRPLTAHSRLCSVAGGDGGYTTRAPL